MPTGTVLLAELSRPVGEAELARLRCDMLEELVLNGDDFQAGGPLQIVRSRLEGPVPTVGSERSTWIEVNLWVAYFSPDYPRGDIETIVRCAEWLEAHFTGCVMWYGHDVDDDNLAPFPAERRRELLQYVKGS